MQGGVEPKWNKLNNNLKVQVAEKDAVAKGLFLFIFFLIERTTQYLPGGLHSPTWWWQQKLCIPAGLTKIRRPTREKLQS